MIKQSDEYKLEESIKNNRIVKHSVNGLIRFLILWIIKYNESIHGYAIMKELDKFFYQLIDEGVLKPSNSSKIYPILRKMEEHGTIVGKWHKHENQKVKYYSITDHGLKILNYFVNKKEYLLRNNQWQLLLDDIMK